MGLVLLAVTPIFVRATAIEWSYYRTITAGAVLSAQDTVSGYQQHFIHVLEDARNLLKTLSPAMIAFDRNGLDCHPILDVISTVEGSPFLWLAAGKGGESILCGASPAGGLPPQAALLALAKGEDARAYEAHEPFQRGAKWHAILRFQVTDQGPHSLWLLADTRLRSSGAMEKGARDAPMWLLRQDGSVSGQDLDLLPAGMPLASIVPRSGTVFSDAARNGARYAYGTVMVSPSAYLLIGSPEGSASRAARDAFLARIGEFILLIACGLMAVWIAADMIVTRPLRRLTQRVMQWRGIDPQDNSETLALPSEFRALSETFGQAVGAVRQRERELTQAREQQTLLMQEIHHRVKNNLQIIASLLNLQASRIKSPQAKAEFQSARDRVQALATLHRHLYTQGELHALNMRSFLNELCGQLFQAFGENAGERIHLHIEAPELRMTSDQAVPLALIVTEVVSNAVKYAFPDERSGTIMVRLTVENDDVCLIIQDDGIGLHAGPEQAGDDVRDGLGRQLVRGFARQLGASLDISADGGTRYELRVRLRTQQVHKSLNGGGIDGEPSRDGNSDDG